MPGSVQTAALISLPEIAALAQVKRPVVTTWRRRHADFPAPVGGDASRPLFDVDTITAWLQDRGLGNVDAAQLQVEAVLHTLVARTARFAPRALVELVTAMLCLRYLDGDAPLVAERHEHAADVVWAQLSERAMRIDAEDEFLLAEIRAADADAVELALLTDDLVDAAYNTREAFEWLLGAHSRLGVAALTADALAPSLVRLIVGATGVESPLRRGEMPIVADPAAGAGDLLSAIANAMGQATDSESGGVYLAAEADGYLARLTRRRLLVRGIAEYDIDVTNSADLTEGLGDPDIIVTSLPYESSEDRHPEVALRRIEGIADLLGPGRNAVMLGPATALVGPLAAYTPAERLRTDLLMSGVVEAVVRLPGGMVPFRPGYQTALWTLTRDPIPQARGRVLLCDVSARELTDELAATVIEDILLWRAEGSRRGGHEPRHGAVRLINDLVDPAHLGVALDPPRRVGPYEHVYAAPERVARILDAEQRLDTLATQTTAQPTHLRSRAERRVGPRPARTTVGRLIDDKRALLLSGSRIASEDIAADGNHAVLGAPEALKQRQVGSRRIDRAVLADRYEYARFTEPGDLVVTTAPSLGVLVDEQGFSIVDFPARVLRIRAREDKATLTPRVLAALLSAAHDTARAPGAVRAARNIADFELPDLADDEIHRLDELLAAIESRQRLLRGQLDALDDVCRLVRIGFADGTLTIDQRPRP